MQSNLVSRTDESSGMGISTEGPADGADGSLCLVMQAAGGFSSSAEHISFPVMCVVAGSRLLGIFA